jgi:hypothetical protein
VNDAWTDKLYETDKIVTIINISGHAVAQWLRHCTTNWKVTGLIPDGVTRIFH